MPRDWREKAGKSESGTDVVEGEDDLDMAVPVAMLADAVPASDERRAVLARGPLAGVDGFRVIVGFVLAYILGMRCCPKCPGCKCADLLGRNATAVGGRFGRAGGVHGGVEAQKSAGS